jgi:putative endonuclease
VDSNVRNGSTPFRGTIKKRLESLLFFMYFAYILYSSKCDRYYIGYTADIGTRIIRHNAGKVTATKNCRPYIVKATKLFATEVEARKEELRLKKMKSRVYLESLIAGNW